MAGKKKSKSALLLIVLLLLGIGVIGYNLVKDPTILQNVPVLKNLIHTTPKTGGVSELQNLQQENDTLKKGLAQKDQELQSLKKQLADLTKQAGGSGEAGQSNQTVNPGNQQADIKSQQTAQISNYQDMAKYFAEMKSKDAADILSRLNDEDIIGILSQMTADAAAEILQNMDHDKAADVSRKMLVTAPSGG